LQLEINDQKWGGENGKGQRPWGLLKTMGLQDVQRLEPMRSQMMRGEKKSRMYV
jgi:hypothetical protein